MPTTDADQERNASESGKPETAPEEGSEGRGQAQAAVRESNSRNRAGMNIDIEARKRVGSALAEGETKYRTLFETMGQGYCELELVRDAEGRAVDQLYIEFNPAFERLFGVPIAEAEGRKASEVFPNLEPFWTETFERVAKTGTPERVEHAVQALGRWFEVFAYPAGADRVFVLYEDVTERKRSEIALREVQDRQAFLLKLSDTLRFLDDPEAVAEAACRLIVEELGASRAQYTVMLDDTPGAETAEVQGEFVRNGAPLVRRFAMNAFGSALVDSLRSGKTGVVNDIRSEKRITREERDIHWNAGSPSHISVPRVRDGRLVVTLTVHGATPREWTPHEISLVEEVAERTWAAVERARAEGALRESEEKYRTLFETIDEGFTIMEAVRDDTGRVVDVIYRQANQAWARLFGSEIKLGSKASELFAYPADAPWIETWNQVLETGEPIREEHHIVSTDRLYNVRFSRIGGPGSDLIAAVFDDITERKRAERELRESEERQAFLLKLSDVLRAESDPPSAGRAAMRLLAEHFKADRAYIVQLSRERHWARIEHEVRKPGLPSVEGEYDLRDLPTTVQEMLANEVFYPDVANHPTLSDVDKQTIKAMGIGAVMAGVLGRGEGEFIWNTAIAMTDPHPWTREELRLLQEAAERIWAAMERARASKAVRESEARLADELQSAHALQNLSSQLITDGSGGHFFKRILDTGMAIMHAGFGSMQMLDEKENVLRLIAWRNFHPEAAKYWQAVSVSTGTSCGSALEHGGRVIIPDVAEDEHLRGTESLRCYEISKIKSVQSTPLTTRDGRVIGMISTHWGEEHVPQERELRLFDILARQAADYLERSAAEEALRAREADLARVQRIGEVGGLDIDIAGGMRSRRSPEYLRLHGLGPDHEFEEHGQWLARLHPEDRERAEATLFEALNGKAGFYESEYRIIRPSDGKTRWIHARADIERDKKGKPVRLVGAHLDVTDHKQMQEALREGEDRRAFLLELTDALRPLEQAADIEQTAVRMLGEKLGVNRVFYATIDSDGEYWSIRHDYVDGVPSGPGRFPMSEFQRKRLPGWEAGNLSSVADSETDPGLTADDRAAYAAFGTRAAIGVPLVKGGRFVALLSVNHSAPRHWTEAELMLTRDAAERTWVAIERARGEEALRASEERLRLIVESARDYAIFTTDKDNIIVDWMPGAQAVFGFTKEEAEGQPATILFTPEDRANGEPQKEIETAAREGKAPDVRWHMCKTGERVFIEGQVVPLRGSGNGITGFLKIGQDVTERRQAEAALSDSEERFRQFGEASSDLLWIRDAETLAFEYLSPAFERLYGVPREQVLERNNVQAWLDLIHPDDRESAVTALRSLRNGIPINDEFRMIGHDEIRWVQNTDFPLRDETGKVVRIAGIAQDITERKRAIEMQATLLAELQHRVRNTLAVVRSIARRTAETSGTADEMLAHFQGRLDAFSRVQAALTRNASGSVDLHSLVDDELVAHAAREGQLIKVEGPPLCLEAKTAERMSLAIHELVTNAVKHGALATPEGRIAVDWKVDNSGDRPRLLFNWAESGVSLDPDAAPTDGFGTELLLRSLPYDLGAETNLELRRDGIRFEFAMPLPGEA